jgi:hypothetical protein
LLLEILSDYIGEIPSVDGMEIPSASDYHGYNSIKSAAA